MSTWAHGSLGPQNSGAFLVHWSDLDDQLHENALKTFPELYLPPVNNTYYKLLDTIELEEQLNVDKCE